MTSKAKKTLIGQHNTNDDKAKKNGKFFYMLLGAGALILATIIGLVIWFYSSHALPNVAVGRTNVSQDNIDEVKKAIQDQSTFYVTFSTDSKQNKVPSNDIGLTVDIDATAKNAMQARRDGDFWQNIQLWQTKTVPLVFVNDPGMLKKYIQENFPEVFVDAVDAQLAFNEESNSYDIIPGTNGSGFDLKKFEAMLPDLALNPRDVSLAVSISPVEPLIQASKLESVKADVNERINLPIKFILNDRTVYQLTQSDIANWTHFIPDVVNGTYTIEFDKAGMEQFVANTLSPMVTVTPIDRKVVVDKDTGAQTVISAGRTGYTIQDADVITNNIMDALAQKKPLDQTISVGEAPFKTVTMSGSSKWIEVDLSRQTVTLYIGDQAIQTFVVSTGKAATPTAIGEGAISAKYPLQTMTGTINGEYYYVPNIKWVSYFYGSEAFHGTYWHHNFGTPMSHGCVNMTEDDAKVLYDFAPIGTKVVVHQ